MRFWIRPSKRAPSRRKSYPAIAERPRYRNALPRLFVGLVFSRGARHSLINPSRQRRRLWSCGGNERSREIRTEERARVASCSRSESDPLAFECRPSGKESRTRPLRSIWGDVAGSGEFLRGKPRDLKSACDIRSFELRQRSSASWRVFFFFSRFCIGLACGGGFLLFRCRSAVRIRYR